MKVLSPEFVSFLGALSLAGLGIPACGDDPKGSNPDGSDAGNDASQGSGGAPASGGRTGTGGVGTGGVTNTGGTPAAGGTSATGGRGAGGTPDAGGPECGNQAVESGETCDTGIASGSPGSCPTAPVCSDSNPCTVDTIQNAGTCTAACDSSTAVPPDLVQADLCCPAGASSATDIDCDPNCGNGRLDPNETCDTGITSADAGGVNDAGDAGDAGRGGACPTSCADDGDPCTREALVTADPCNPTCATTTITTAANGDSCCPAGANANSDDDCTPRCGNSVVESGEECDDATAECSGCRFVRTAFRLTSLTMLDPHPQFDDGAACTDVAAAFNTIIQNNIAGDVSGGPDGGADGTIDLNFVITLHPLRQVGSGGADFYQGLCAAPAPGSSCGPDPTQAPSAFIATSQTSGTCLAPDPSKVTASYTPPVQATTAGPNGCFVSDERTFALRISGIDLTFDNARLSGQWRGDPATGMLEGLFVGFMSEARAAAGTLPPALGSLPVAALFPRTGTASPGCVDDSDVGPDGTTVGWWWHLSFVAERVTWSEP